MVRLACFSLLAFLVAGCQGFEGDREANFKIGDSGPRYLQNYLRPNAVAKLGERGNYTNRDKDTSKALFMARDKALSLPAITNLDEDIYLIVEDLDGVGYTMAIHNGNVDLREGLREGVKPTMVITLRKQDAIALPSLLSAKGVDARGRAITGLTADSMFKLVGFLYLPAIETLYAQDALNPPEDKGKLGLDDLVQLEISAPTGSDASSLRATIVNIDGQWLFLPGWRGDPDIRVRLSVLDALDLYKAGVYDFKKAESATDKALLARRFLELRQKATTYIRPDHK